MRISRLPRSLLARFPLVWQVRIVLASGLFLNNLVGALALFLLAGAVIPVPDVPDEAALRRDNVVLAGLAVVVGTTAITLASRHLTVRLVAWLREGREPDDVERLAILRAPAQLFALHAVLWGLGTAIFGIYNARVVPSYGLMMATMVGLSGLTVSAVAFLVAERSLRPLARRALSGGQPERVIVPSVASRAIVAWALSSGVVLLGVVITGLGAAALEDQVTERQLATTVAVLGGLGFVVGGFTNLLAARASSDPVRALRLAVARVAEGDLDARVDIYDGTELGILQAGFNDMVHGLRERETIRDLFGKHVGRDVAHEALEEGVRFTGEVREVVVLFVDIVGSTTMAANRPPEEVVTVLNRFFRVVIDVVHEHRGWINKFEGDAALAIWGAPAAVPAQESLALAAARVLGERLAVEVPEITAGVGVSAGPAVAGNVGAAERYEYTVIGDPVNEAARLSELAKSVPGYVVANAALLNSAYVEGERWTRLKPVKLRGRDQRTEMAAPQR